MRKNFAVAQVVGVLEQAEVGVPVAKLIRKMGLRNRLTTARRPNMRA